MNRRAALLLFCVATLFPAGGGSADDGYRLWLKYDRIADAGLLESYRRAITTVEVAGESATCNVVRNEIREGLGGLLDRAVSFRAGSANAGTLVVGTPASSRLVQDLDLTDQLKNIGPEGYLIKRLDREGAPRLVVTANEDIGLLYGTFHLLRLIQTHASLESLDIASRPRIQNRLLNHWDNLDGTIERGYAGGSLWTWDDLPDTVDSRYVDYARANASIGINGTVVNSVNANPVILTDEYLKKVAKLADLFRPFGLRVFLSANFSSPISAEFSLEANRKAGIGDLSTSDPMDSAVQQWWKDKVADIYALIPDFGGFLVKANSEGMPGPQEFGRTHADGANMLAEALAPHGGIVMWRAFVYTPDTDSDRAKRAYKDFVPLDGQFAQNVFVQAKNGPIDFQPREPIQPLFGAMPKTPMILELQPTQEYLGHSTHLVYLAPMWKEYLDTDTYAKGEGATLAGIIDGSVQGYAMTGIAGVANTGNDRNWCGHLFGQANWYAYGRLSWDHTLSAEAIADEWIRMTFGNDPEMITPVMAMMMGSWEACIDYMTPLGLHHIMQAGFHYGPEPSFANSREDWTSVYYHRADEDGIGYNRSATGSDATGQYPSPLKNTYGQLETCPEEFLLWFHHVPWDHTLSSGRTLWDELCMRYERGTDYVDTMRTTWDGLESKIDPEVFRHVSDRLETHQQDARIWRDTCLTYFQTFSKRPIPGQE